MSTATGEVPDYAEAARGMIDVMSTLSWWKRTPAADLTGGKDSRVTAAAAIRAGAVDAVRTVNTDAGEVETAERLLALAGNPVSHRVTESKPPKAPEGGVFARYLAAQRAWEGGYNAMSAHRGAMINGFGVASTPTINGLGGEAIQGHTLATAKSRKQLASQDANAGHDWLMRLVTMNSSILDDERSEPARAAIRSFVERARSLGLNTAFQMLDFFYHFSKMPYWSQPQMNPGALLPFYSPKLLPRTMWSLNNPSVEYGGVHRELLRRILPAWADVPFYKGSPKTRSIPWMWENEDWYGFQEVVRDGVRSLESFVPEKVDQSIAAANAGKGVGRHEVELARVMWELSFREFAREIDESVKRTVEGVALIRSRR